MTEKIFLFADSCFSDFTKLNGKIIRRFFIVEQVSISSTLNVRIFRTNVVLAAFFMYTHTNIRRTKDAKMMFVQNICGYNVDEIDHRLETIPAMFTKQI